jgi:hypothetical protein
MPNGCMLLCEPPPAFDDVDVATESRWRRWLSLLGHSRHFERAPATSDLPSTADISH